MLIVTGASRGLGKFLLNHYAATEDAVGTYLSTPPATDRELLPVDVTKEEDVKRFFDQLGARAQNLTIINCAGINANARVGKFDLSSFRQVVDVAVTGSFLMTKHAMPIMQAQNFGRVINVSSVVPQIGVPGTVAYSASKSALWGMTKTIAKECAGANITCNCLTLGYFDIGMISEVPEKMKAIILSSIPMKRFGDPLNIVNAIDFVRKSDYLTGSSIDLNGGLF
jgi:NAD(P)-dependent dehydrogenase (short-subunit alcohol dehydrogenase family)